MDPQELKVPAPMPPALSITATEDDPLLHTTTLARRDPFDRSLSPHSTVETRLLIDTSDLESGVSQRQEQALFNMVLRFVLNNFLPQRLRTYFAAHPSQAQLALVLLLAIIALVLYLTGNLMAFALYLKLAFCFLFGSDDSLFQFCWA